MQTCKSNFTEIFYIHRQPGEKKPKNTKPNESKNSAHFCKKYEIFRNKRIAFLKNILLSIFCFYSNILIFKRVNNKKIRF